MRTFIILSWERRQSEVQGYNIIHNMFAQQSAMKSEEISLFLIDFLLELKNIAGVQKWDHQKVVKY